MRECVDGAVETRAPHRRRRPPAARARAGPAARPRAARARRGGRAVAVRAAASSRCRSARSSSSPAWSVSGKIDRVDGDPMGARGIVHRLQVGRGAPSARRDPRRDRAADPALHARAARPARAGADGRRLRARRRRPPAARDAAGRRRPGARVRRARLPRAGRVRRGGRARARARRSGSPGGSARATSATTRMAANARTWCDLWRMCRKERP